VSTSSSSFISSTHPHTVAWFQWRVEDPHGENHWGQVPNFSCRIGTIRNGPIQSIRKRTYNSPPTEHGFTWSYSLRPWVQARRQVPNGGLAMIPMRTASRTHAWCTCGALLLACGSQPSVSGTPLQSQERCLSSRVSLSFPHSIVLEGGLAERGTRKSGIVRPTSLPHIS